MKYIYIRTNLVNGKQYVGQTQNLIEREKAWRKINSNIYGNKYFSNDRKKYGLDNFSFEILETCDDEKSDELEQYYIKKYNTIYPNGYNIQSGGKKGFTYKEMEETKIKKSISHKGKIPPCVKQRPVNQFTLDGLFLRAYKSTREVERQTGFHHANISACCKGKYKQAYNSIWKYAEDC